MRYYMLEEIKGIGPKTIASLNKLNIYTSEDLLTYYPYRYNFYQVTNITNDSGDKSIVINGTIASIPRIFYIKRTLNRLMFKFNTGNVLINVTIFNRGYLKPNLTINKLITIIGKYNPKNNSFMASDIKLTPIMNMEFEPVYHLIQDIKRANFIKILNNLLNQNYYLNNYIPDEFMQKYHFISTMEAVKIIHHPNSELSLKASRLMLSYEELFVFMLKINFLKQKRLLTQKCKIKTFDDNKITTFIKSLPFTLTDDQVNAVEKIKEDFNSNKQMNRLILGDVGSGKTIVSFIAMYMNSLAGYQSVLMAPTEILAVQHYDNMVNLFAKLNLNIKLLTSSTSKKERLSIIKELYDGSIDVLIGTHSVLNDDLKFKKLGLVITDEQHRFGVKQRENLQNKGEYVDVIYLSATPIPRTLALTIYGDMDISKIKTKPSNRKPVETKILKYHDLKIALSAVLEEIKQNHQAYIIAPLIEDENGTNLETTSELAKKIDLAFNHKIPIGILHGKLKGKAKEEVINDFKENKTKILVSTTVVEVGVDIKNATTMIIFNAERFGLATLHQLRGRIGRNDFACKCFLISDQEIERLKVLEQSNDGFYISEKDFEMRGSGDLFGVKQSGDLSFKIANLKTDFKVLLQCKEDSASFLKDNIRNLNQFPLQKEVLESISQAD